MNIQKMMKQAMQMQAKMQQAQADLAGKTVEASSGGGRVTATANGHGDITAVKIAKEIVDPEDVEMLQDLVLSAIQQAQAKVKEIAGAEMSKVTGGLGLPPGLGM